MSVQAPVNGASLIVEAAREEHSRRYTSSFTAQQVCSQITITSYVATVGFFAAGRGSIQSGQGQSWLVS
jgi:hypothetical protein